MRVRPSEWQRVGVYALLLIALTTIPYLVAASLQNDEYTFSGYLVGVEDGNSYLGKMRIGARGDWNYAVFYTSEQHDSAPLVFFPYILAGQIVGTFIPHTSPMLTPALLLAFHGARAVFNFLLIFVTYRFIAEFLNSSGTRFFALLIATLGGGFGWLLFFVGGVPPEWFIPEGFTFVILYYLPHITLARAALLWGLLCVLWLMKREASIETQRIAPLQGTHLPLQILAGTCWLVVGLNVPFFLTILYAILGAWGLAAWVRARRFPTRLFGAVIIPALITLPLFIHFALAFANNPVFRQWTAQNLLPSPSPIDYALAYGVIAVFAVIGGHWAWRKKSTPFTLPLARGGGGVLLIGWLLIVPILVYLPFINVQRRMSEAVIVPLAILTAVGVRLVARHLKAWRRWRLALVVFMLPAYIFLVGAGIFTATQRRPPMFYPTAQLSAFQWLNENLAAGDVVLSAFSTGNVIPAYTNARSFAGHGPETLYALDKTQDIARFFRGEISLDELQALYSSAYTLNPIRYVFYGVDEQRLSGGSRAWAAGLTRIYVEGEYEIYAVP